MDVWRTVELSARLRTAGLRATGPRLAVLDALIRLGGHRRADEVHSHLTGQGRDLARASVYNV
ncbi:transcriptional repressor, partial [Frankia sp. CiP1_Cm_nod2]